MPFTHPCRSHIYDLPDENVDEHGLRLHIRDPKGDGGGRGGGGGGGRSGNGGGTSRGSASRTSAGGYKGGRSKPGSEDGRPVFAGGGGGGAATIKPQPRTFDRPPGSSAGGALIVGLGASVVVAGVVVPLALLSDAGTRMGWCDGVVSLPQAIDNCSIADTEASRYAIDTMFAIGDWRDANSTTSLIEQQAGVADRFDAILASNCSLPVATRQWVEEWRDYLGGPNDIPYIETDINKMCTEGNPQLPNTAITSEDRDYYLQHGVHLAEMAQQFYDKGCKYGDRNNMTQVVFDLGNATRSSFEDPQFRAEARTNFSSAGDALYESDCSGFELWKKDKWQTSLNETRDILASPDNITAVQQVN